MAPLAVDPQALDNAGAKVISTGEGLDSVASTLASALGGCGGMAGDDPAGSAFGGSYNAAASKLLEAMATTRNGLCRLGDGVRMSAHNYSVAEANSNISGHGQPLPGPHPTGPIAAGSAPSAVGNGVAAPAGWGWVARYIGMIWPNGDSSRLRAAAAAWISAGTDFEVNEVLGATGPLASIGAQQIPEAEAIAAAFADATRSTSGILQQCATIAAQLNALATSIDTAHAAILDLLSRICDPLTGIKEVWEFLTDQDEDEIKKIANDIRLIVNQFTREVDALRQQLASTVAEATIIVSTMGRYAERQWDQFLHHTDVGRALNQVGQYGKGLAESAGGLIKDGWTYGPIREFVDPAGSQQSWKELINGMAPLVGLGGDDAPGVAHSWKELGKNAVHWDEWSTNPAEAAGKSTFDVATFLVPGGGEAAAAVKGGRAAAEAAEATSRAEAAATGALEHSAVPGASARAPHVEPLAPARPSALPDDRPPPPSDKPVVPGPTKPAPAPPDAVTPHSPTESRPPTTTPEASAASAQQHPASTPSLHGEPAGVGRPQALELASAHHAAVSDGPTVPVGGTAPAAHPQMPDLPPPSSHLSLPHDVHSSGNATLLDGHSGGGHGGSDGHGGSTDRHGDSGGHGAGDAPGTGRHDPVHSSDASGDGWERLPDEPRDPHYGEPLAEHWASSYDPTELSQTNLEVGHLMKDTDAHFGRDPEGQPYTQHQYEERFNKLGPEGQHWYHFASPDGALAGSKVGFNSLERFQEFYGQSLDRIGDENGSYLAVMEEGKSASWEARSLHVDSLSKPLHLYTMTQLPEGWMIEVSKIEPALGQPGGALQVRMIDEEGTVIPVEQLRREGILR